MSGNLYGKGISSVPYISPSVTNQSVASVSNLSKLGIIPRVIYVTDVALNKATTSLIVDGTETLTFTISPADADTKIVTWSSSDEEVATVVDGLVTAIGAGEATITATATDGSGKTDTCVVTVTTE